MSQRNPMNDRYTTDAHKGVARKSAASAKPKSKAAASVVIRTEKKTSREKKADAKEARKQARDEQRRLDQKYYKPDTQRYKTLRRLWWVCLACAVVCVALSFLARSYMPDWLSIVVIVAAYVFIILAFYIDFSKIKKERREYQDRMVLLEAQQIKEQKEQERLERQQVQRRKRGSGKNANNNPKAQQKAAQRNAAARESEKAAQEALEKDKADENAAEAQQKRWPWGRNKKVKAAQAEMQTEEG